MFTGIVQGIVVGWDDQGVQCHRRIIGDCPTFF